MPIIGYGAVKPATADDAGEVLRGEEPVPERPAEDAFFEGAHTQRQAAYDVYTTTGGDEGLDGGRAS
jgi:hypothetical protein